ncbi:MAG: PilZ domain-containing protein [Actinobacteria bacterium]|nr:PilZ domain-containing protein [Actinomycetota bacterium]
MTIQVDNASMPSYQRRIGERYPIRVDLEWGPIQLSRWKRKKELLTATTDNVSLSGLGFETETHGDVVRGTAVTISLAGVRCNAAVRVARPGRKAGHSYYGLEFRDQHMIDAIESLIDGYRGDVAPDSPRAAGGSTETPSLSNFYYDDPF